MTGITPAHAGKSCPPQAPTFTRQDHPRVCGEKDKAKEMGATTKGSPPRMRGKESGCVPGLPGSRITPAHAGKRDKTAIFEEWCRDHPCVCGEKTKPVPAGGILMGSPPRMRGKGSGTLPHYDHQGITPACAGKSLKLSSRTTGRRDHPRVCGEKLSTTSTDIHPAGSPPRMRGKVHVCHCSLIRRRITPARAGKSSIQHLTASLGEFEVQKGHPVPHLRQRLQVWPDHARHLRHGLILHASRSAGQGRRLCPGPCPDTAGSGTALHRSPAKRPHTSPPAATPGGCRAWQSGATAPGSR